MSREVEIQNIQMTATTPEDVQISLGTISSGSGASTSDAYSLAGNTGILLSSSNVVTAPRVDHSVTGYTVDTDAGSYDWSNTADISAYYEIGKLIPASSTTGLNVFFTPDSNGVGKTVKEDAKFYQAATSLTAGTTSGASDMATLHAATSTNKTTSGTSITTPWLTATEGVKYTQSTAWNTTNDDGYYVDIPVWLRTSSTQSGGTPLSVDAYVIPKGATTSTAAGANDRDLYKAVRVAVISTGETPASSNLIPVRDGLDGTTFMTLPDPYAASNTNTVFTNDYYKRSSGIGAGKEAVESVNGSNVATYNDVTKYTAGTAVTTLAAGTGTTYGDPTKLIIRVWLEGEDKDCWNETAGQDWSINLKFEKIEPVVSGG